MHFLLRAGAAAIVGFTACIASEAAFAQAGDAPPAGEASPAPPSAAPGLPGEATPVLPPVRLRPPLQSAPMRGSDCSHSSEPGTGV